MTQDEKDKLKRIYLKGATDNECEIFFSFVEKTGLDPRQRQLYFVRRGGKGTTQISIDGLRTLAAKTGEMDGLQTQWCGPDGVWADVWLGDGPPAAARVDVYRRHCRHPFTGIARWDEYQSGGPMWAKMQALMLAKCAAALAYRCAFPMEVSGLYTSEEMDQADDPVVEQDDGVSDQAYEDWKEEIATVATADGTTFEDVLEAIKTQEDEDGDAFRARLRGPDVKSYHAFKNMVAKKEDQ